METIEPGGTFYNPVDKKYYKAIEWHGHHVIENDKCRQCDLGLNEHGICQHNVVCNKGCCGLHHDVIFKRMDNLSPFKSIMAL